MSLSTWILLALVAWWLLREEKPKPRALSLQEKRALLGPMAPDGFDPGAAGCTGRGFPGCEASVFPFYA